MVTIRIGVPLYGKAEVGLVDFVRRLYTSKKYNVTPAGRYCYYKGSLIANNRNRSISSSSLTKQVDFDFDYYLSLDADTWYAGDADHLLDTLIAHDKLVVGAAYPYRLTYTDKFVAWNWGRFVGEVVPIAAESVGLLKVDGIGGGCTLHKVDVFRKLPFPWFYYPVTEYMEESFSGSECVGFATRCTSVGIPIHVDTNLICEHSNSYQVTK